MRTFFALTIALGVFTPTLTIDKAKGITTRIDYLAPDLRDAALKPTVKPFGDLVIEGGGRELVLYEAPVERPEKPVALRVDEPAVDKAKEPAADEKEAAIDKKAKQAAIDKKEAVIDEEDVAGTVEIERVCEALADAATAQGLPVGFFARLIWQESKFDQWARSPVGAMGVAQFMPPTAAEYGLQDPFDPIESVAASARFLRELRDQFGNLGLAAAAYNAGGGRIRRWLNGQGALPEETRNYVHKITGHPPKRWTVRQPLEVSVALPQRAPCDGVEGLSRTASAARHDVRLTGLSVELIEEAETARRAKIAAARAARNKRHAKSRKAVAVRVAGKVKTKAKSKATATAKTKAKAKVAARARAKAKVRVAQQRADSRS